MSDSDNSCHHHVVSKKHKKKEKKNKKDKKHKHKKRSHRSSDSDSLSRDGDSSTTRICVNNTVSLNEKIPMVNTNQTANSSEAFGPALPPHLQIEMHARVDDLSIIGPSLPQGMVLKVSEETQESDDEEIVGPVPLDEGSFKAMTTAQIELEQRALEIKLAKLDPDANKVDVNVREEWMLELPDVGLKTGLSSLKRTFHTKERPDFSDRSSWTKTPNSSDVPTTSKVTETSKSKAEEKYQAQRDAEQAKIAKKLKKKHKRDESLYEIHQKKLKKDKKDKESTGKIDRRPFSREVDLQPNKIDKNQTKKIVDKAKFLDSRFSTSNLMPLSKQPYKNDATIRTLDFSKVGCFLGEFQQSGFGYVASSELGKPAVMSIKKAICKPNPLTSTLSSAKPLKIISKQPTHVSTSRNLIDTQHRLSLKCSKFNLNKMCPDSQASAAHKLTIGNCSTKNIKAQGKIVFNLTEDPLRRFCLSNPNFIHSKSTPQLLELDNIKKLVETADNDFTNLKSQSIESSVCEVIDLANPLGLDYQGIDYKNTYQRDEQTLQNQFEFRKLQRHQHRKNVNRETIFTTEKEQQAERIAYPKHFFVNGSPLQTKSLLELPKHIEKTKLYGKLVRADDKPNVKQRLEYEEKNRRDRYKQLYLKKKEKNTLRDDENKTKLKNAIENKSKMLAEIDAKNLVSNFDHNITTKKREPQKKSVRKTFPNTIAETLKLRHELKKSKRVLKDRARITQEFYTQVGKNKRIPVADLEISSDSRSPSSRNNEQSTNDEDDMIVGKKGTKFHLRGFQNKLGSNLRGKFYRNEINRGHGLKKGCITREKWFESLLSRKVKKSGRKYVERVLFPLAFGLGNYSAQSAVKEFQKKPIGRHYAREIRKILHFKKPKQIKVKKFNLIGYLYGSADSKRKTNKIVDATINNNVKIKELGQGIKSLGISCAQENQQIQKTNCISSDSSDSDWIPDDTRNENIQESVTHSDFLVLGNMPAPQTRETTIRRHPRHPRDNNLRIPSALFDEFMKTQHLPILTKLKDDKIVAKNINTVKKTDFAKIFDARHHHDHWNPVQHKSLHVKYSRKLVYPTKIEFKTKEITPPFYRVLATDKRKNNEDFSLPKKNTTELIQKQRLGYVKSQKEQTQNELLFQSKDKVYHSLENEDIQKFPGREKFLRFISEISAELNKSNKISDPELVINKNDFITELKEDLRSIESCLSSLSSSYCTNLTNESGSFLIAGDKKIPLDYLRKSVVPFEKLNRNLIEAVPIDSGKKELNPFKTVPFSGQKKEQIALSSANDNFFTFSTRIQNGLRQRLNIKKENVHKKLIGSVGGSKAVAQVAIDIDELYIEDLINCRTTKLFKWKSCRTMIKDALRKKFESMLIQGEIVRNKINDRHNNEYFQQMKTMHQMFEKLFAKWEKKEYESAMEVVNKIKPYYEATDKYRTEYQELTKKYTVLNMEIVYIENEWMRRKILQNFHYLIADMKWRVEHDWIHRNANGELEGFAESIAKRNTVNMRKREKNDAVAIQEYYEDVYLKNVYPNVIVFNKPTEFVAGVENLKAKTFAMLLELHYTLRILAELKQKFHELSDWCARVLQSKKVYVEIKCAKKYFMQNRAEQLKKQVQIFLGYPIEATFGDKRWAKIRGICNEAYKDLIPFNNQMDLGALEQTAVISETLIDIIAKLESIPVEQRTEVEKKHRRLLKYRRNVSKQAVLVERRIASEIVKVQRNLAPPFKKHIRESKLYCSETKKIVRVVREKPHAKKDLKDAHYNVSVIENIEKPTVPFYFDHFLIINGYQPNYDFKTKIELRDGPEIDRFQMKSVLPEVLEKFDKWQVAEKKIMEENIRQNPKMYQNVPI